MEHTEYAAMMRRCLRAWGRRCMDADMEDLAELIELRRLLDEQIAETITTARARHGWSWDDIGRAAGVSRQRAHARWSRGDA